VAGLLVTTVDVPQTLGLETVRGVNTNTQPTISFLAQRNLEILIHIKDF